MTVRIPVQFEVLQKVVDFFYNREVYVPDEMVESFECAARVLKFDKILVSQ